MVRAHAEGVLVLITWNELPNMVSSESGPWISGATMTYDDCLYRERSSRSRCGPRTTCTSRRIRPKASGVLPERLNLLNLCRPCILTWGGRRGRTDGAVEGRRRSPKIRCMTYDDIKSAA